MRKSLTILGILILTAFLSGFLIRSFFNSKTDISSYQKTLETYLKKSDKQICDFLLDSTAINGIYKKSHPENFLAYQQLTKKITKEVTLLFYEKKDLVFWSSTIAIPEYHVLKNVTEKDTLLRLGNGFFKVKKHPFPGFNDSRCAYSLIPVKFDFAQRNELYSQFFPMGVNIPKSIHVSAFKTKHPVFVNGSQPIVYLQAFNYSGNSSSTWVLFLWSIGFFLVMLSGHLLANRISKKRRVLNGVFFFLLVTLAVRYLIYLFGINELFVDFVNLQNTGENTQAFLLGDTLINVSLLLWLLLFTYKKLKVLNYDHISLGGRFTLAVINFMAILLSALMITGICKDLVLHSGIVFDFNNVFNIGRIGLSALLGINLFLFIFFIVSHRMSSVIRLMKLSLSLRISAIAVSFVAILPFYYSIDPEIPLATFYLSGIIYLVLFDLFIEAKSPSLSWILVWLVLFGGFTSILLFKYSKDADIIERTQVAHQLLERKDKEVILELSSLLGRLKNDKMFQDALQSCSSQAERTAETIKYLQKKISEGYYINNFYNFSINQTDAKLSGQQAMAEWIKRGYEVWQDSLLVQSAGPTLHNYKILLPVRPNSSSYTEWIKLSLSRKTLSSPKDFNALIVEKQFKNIAPLSRYSYAIYQHDSLIESSQHMYESLLPYFLKNKKEESFEWYSDDRTELVYTSEDFTVMVGRDLLGILKPMSLFSYIFILLVLLISLLTFINHTFPILPDRFTFDLNFNLSLRNKIQLSVLALILISFISIGFITFLYFKNTTRSQDKEKLREKAISIQNDATQNLKSIDLNDRNTIRQLVERLSDTHYTDIQMYNKDGKLLAASNMSLFDNAVIAPYINPKAYIELKLAGKQLLINEDEKIGKIEYMVAFIPLRKQSNQAPVAFISLPYSGDAIMDPGNAKDFMGTLLNVYVFLLIIAGGIAILVANSITRPILVLGEKLKDFKLGTRNEPIPWDSNDELGALIKEYNILIEKMEKSAELLAQTEREVAWREMAKQVAHEIKNPLTPMKLSIQYLQHKIGNLSKDEIEPLVSRVSSTLIEQIDNLNKIASEFSNFSKLPKPNNEPLVLNDLIASVHDLFRKRDDIIFNLYVPIDEIFVFADRSHILRILNNLIKNAIQAIPGIRKGKIDIKLYTKNNKAIIQVSDNGTGIPKDMQDKVFYPNFTTKSSGTGLGLAICKDMVDAYGGKLYFKTLENVGTDFYVELPLLSDEDRDSSSPI